MSEKKYADYTQCATLTELDVIHADHVHQLHEKKQEERELVARLLACRASIDVEEDYVEDLSTYIKDFLKTSIYPDKRAKLVRKAHERYLKKFKEQEYKLVMEIKELRELAMEANRFSSLDGFNPNGIRASMMRGNLEKAILRTAALPETMEVLQLRADIREQYDKYTPRTPEQIEELKKQKQQQQASLEQAVANVAKDFMEKLKDGKSIPEIVDMKPIK